MARWPSRSEAGPPAASCLQHRQFLRKPPRRWVRLQNRHAYTMCRNDQSGIVAMAATLCGSEAAPALAEVAAAVASFSSCLRFFATSLSCSALAFREAGGSRPRQSEPSSSVLPAGVQGLDAVKFLVSASTELLSAGRIPNRLAMILRVNDDNDKCAVQQGVCQVRNGAYVEHIAESAALLQVLRESQPSSRRELVRRQSWCVRHWSAMECRGCRAPRPAGARSYICSRESAVRYGARSASPDAKR